MNKGLGRKIQFDERSRLFPVRALISSVLKPRSYTWSCPITLDQGQTSSCVGHAFAHEAAARPVKILNIGRDDAFSVYRRALQLDEWEGEADEGTSILAGVKACVERGWYTGYRWAFSVEEVILALGYKGPVVLGIPWYEGMGDVGPDGFVQVSGAMMGFHAIVTNAVSLGRQATKLHNSWGPTDWGDGGEAWISFADLRRLLSEQGEACIPIGRKIPFIRKLVGFMQNKLADL